MKTKEPAYRVGYARPPKEHQFRPGQSGNPSGRPKGTRSFKSDLRDELGELVSVSDGDNTVEVTKQRAIIKKMLRQALDGDLRAIAMILTSCARVFDGDGDDDDEPEAPEDRAIMQAIATSPTKDTP